MKKGVAICIWTDAYIQLKFQKQYRTVQDKKRNMNKIDFWVRASNYSTVLCGIVLICKMFFRKYLENIIVPILFVGGIALLVVLISELMKFYLKRKSND